MPIVIQVHEAVNAAVKDSRPRPPRFQMSTIAFVLLVQLALTGTIHSQAPARRQSAPSIFIGGYRIAVGMPIAEVNAGLGSVLRPELTGPDMWDYMQGDETVAQVLLKNGRVSHVNKWFGVRRSGEEFNDQLLRGVGEAVSEFSQVARGYACSRAQPGTARNDESVVLEQYCGPFMLRIVNYKATHSNGETSLGVLAQIQLFVPE